MSERTVLDVAPFLLHPDAGDCGVYAVQSVLQALDRKASYHTLKAVSGDGFKFVYDRQDVFEPMRDLTPTDFVRDALAFYNVEGSWHGNLALEEVDKVLAESLEAGWPVITSNLLDTHTGYQIIFGIEPGDVPRIAVRGGLLEADLEEDDSPKRPSRWVPIDALWDGPVSSRARWVSTPLFIIEDTGSKRAPKLVDRLEQAASAGNRACEVFEIPYGTTGLEDVYAAEPVAGRAAAHGAEAWAVLGEEIKSRPSLADTGFIWKVDTVMRRLAHDREALAEFFGKHAGRAKGRTKAALSQLVETLEATVEGARELRALVWHREALEATTAEEMQSYLTSTRALAFPLGDTPGLGDELRERGYGDRIHEHTWGDAIMMEDNVRWLEVVRSVRELADLEAEIEATLPRLTDFEIEEDDED